MRPRSVQSILGLFPAILCLALLVACAVQSAGVPDAATQMTVEEPAMERPSPAAPPLTPMPPSPAPTATPAVREARGRAPGGVVVTEILSIRAGPGYRYQKVGELIKGAEFDIVARWCGHNPDEDWYLIGIRGDEQRWIPGGRQYVSTWLADNLVCLVPPPTPTATPVDPHFRADRTAIAPGECVQLEWDAEQIQAIYLDGEPVARRSVRRVCPALTWTYVLTVVERDGRRNDYPLTVEVRDSLVPTVSSETPESVPPGPPESATPTPTFPQVVTDPDALIEFQLAIGRYRLAEKATLRSPDSDAAEQLRDFAIGETLETALKQVKRLQKQGLVAELSIPQMDMRIAVLQDERTAEVLVQEQHVLRTYRLTSDGNVLIEEEVFDGTRVYSLIRVDSQWKVERIRPVSAAGP